MSQQQREPKACSTAVRKTACTAIAGSKAAGTNRSMEAL